MPRLVKIKRDGKDLPQSFLRGPIQSGLDLSFISEDIIKDDRPSVVARINNNKQVIKLVRPWKWHDYFRLFWANSSINKELKGNSILHALEVAVPEIVEYGLSFFPSSKYEFIGYYVMENLETQGMQDASSLLLSGGLDPNARALMYSNIYTDLKKMQKHQVLFSDLRLSNIFADATGRIVWIDTGVKKYSINNRKKFESQFDRYIERILKPYREHMSEAEIGQIESLRFNS